MCSLTEHLLVGGQAVFLKEVLGRGPWKLACITVGVEDGNIRACSCDQFLQKRGGGGDAPVGGCLGHKVKRWAQGRRVRSQNALPFCGVS